MKKTATYFGFIIFYLLAFSPLTSSRDVEAAAPSAFIIKEFGDLKRSAQHIRDHKKYKKRYNNLGGTVNDLIDAIIISIKLNHISKKEEQKLSRDIEKVNKEISEINLEINAEERNESAYFPYSKKTAQLSYHKKFLSKSIMGFVNINLPQISISVEDIKKLFYEIRAKEDFIEKIESKKWPIMQ